MVLLLIYLSQKYHMKFMWKYFATSNFKGGVDGVGWQAKSLVRQLICAQNGKIVVLNSLDSYKAACSIKAACSKIINYKCPKKKYAITTKKNGMILLLFKLP